MIDYIKTAERLANLTVKAKRARRLEPARRKALQKLGETEKDDLYMHCIKKTQQKT